MLASERLDNIRYTMKISPPLDFQALIEAIAVKRDRKSFGKLFDYYAPRLNGYLQKMGINAETAEEVIQDVMITIWRKADLFDPKKSSVSTWIYRIARNRSIDVIRKNKLEFLDFDNSNIDIEQNVYEEEQDLLEREKNMQQALTLLPSEQLELVRLAFFEGLSHIQIAAKTGLPLGTVKSRIRLGFSRLKKEILIQYEMNNI